MWADNVVHSIFQPRFSVSPPLLVFTFNPLPLISASLAMVHSNANVRSCSPAQIFMHKAHAKD